MISLLAWLLTFGCPALAAPGPSERPSVDAQDAVAELAAMDDRLSAMGLGELLTTHTIDRLGGQTTVTLAWLGISPTDPAMHLPDHVEARYHRRTRRCLPWDLIVAAALATGTEVSSTKVLYGTPRNGRAASLKGGIVLEVSPYGPMPGMGAPMTGPRQDETYDPHWVRRLARTSSPRRGVLPAAQAASAHMLVADEDMPLAYTPGGPTVSGSPDRAPNTEDAIAATRALLPRSALALVMASEPGRYRLGVHETGGPSYTIEVWWISVLYPQGRDSGLDDLDLHALTTVQPIAGAQVTQRTSLRLQRLASRVALELVATQTARARRLATSYERDGRPFLRRL